MCPCPRVFISKQFHFTARPENSSEAEAGFSGPAGWQLLQTRYSLTTWVGGEKWQKLGGY